MQYRIREENAIIIAFCFGHFKTTLCWSMANFIVFTQQNRRFEVPTNGGYAQLSVL
jgi:hypothetical protein